MNETVPTLTDRRPTLSAWLGLIRFSHTIFALPFAILAMVLAWSTPLPQGFVGDAIAYPRIRVTDVLGVLLCMVTARSAAMAFNRWADHQIDAANPRTASRHLPAGMLTRGQVMAFIVLSGLGFVASTLLFLPNRLPVIAAVPVLIFLCGYSLAKRFTSAAHLWLGVALSLSPICVWAAIRGEAILGTPADWIVPFLLAGVVAFWVAGFDILYACQDAAFDAGAGLHSVPARWGIAGALRIAAASHGVMLCFLVALVLLGGHAGLATVFWIAVALSAALIVTQHALVRPDDLSRVNEAFFNTNAAISVLLLIAGIVDCCWV